MPEYFFHIAIELFPNPELTQTESQIFPIDLARAFNDLRPVLRASPLRQSRNTVFDSRRSVAEKKTTSVKATQASPVNDHFIPSSASDHRLDRIQIACADMEDAKGEHLGNNTSKTDPVAKGIGTSISGTQTKGRYVAVEEEPSGTEWGIVHLYRDAIETPGLYKDTPNLGADLWNAGNGVQKKSSLAPYPPPRDEECTTLCILAVPSYLTPADFLAFVGEETRDQVSHFRMIRTARSNRYMVLMKFRNGKQARSWQSEWNGRVFNSMEPETCHVVFLKSVEIVPTSTVEPSENNLHSSLDGSSTFPKMNNDPFGSSTHSTKPLAPRTPSLVELPTCPVCLERMDETTGLLTILCQHVFHCTCLEKWSGGGCPVCRYTHDDFSSRAAGSYKFKSSIHISEYEVSDKPLECETCHADSSLWQCLICGKVGCGRYEGKHAYTHFNESGHNFSMDLESKRVWDYAADVYVHRIIQDAAKPGEKLVELPGRRRDPTALDHDEDIEIAKMENVALEYTHLLTSQLESQRVYFEDIVQRTADKASEATKKAEMAIAEHDALEDQLRVLKSQYLELLQTKIPGLESDRQRLEKRSAKFEDMTKSMQSKFMEEQSLASSLMERIKHLEDTKLVTMQKRIQELEEDNATKDLLMEGLRDEHRDAMMQISAQTRLREMVARGELDEEDLEGATIEAGPAARSPTRRKGKSGAAAGHTTSQSTDDRKAEAQAPQPQQVNNAWTQTMHERLGLGSAIHASATWDEEKANTLLDELRQKMLDAGLVEEKSVDEAEESIEGNESLSVAHKAKKKKKPRKK